MVLPQDNWRSCTEIAAHRASLIGLLGDYIRTACIKTPGQNFYQEVLTTVSEGTKNVWMFLVQKWPPKFHKKIENPDPPTLREAVIYVLADFTR